MAKTKTIKAKAIRPTQNQGLRWQGIYIGFEGNAVLPKLQREEQVKASRRAIEDTFKPAALARWADNRWKRAELVEGEEHMSSLARLVTDELNAGTKPTFPWRFRVRSEDSVVRVTRDEDTPISLPPDVKPDGTVCIYRNQVWIDEVEFLALIEGEAPADGGAPAAATGHPPVHAWMPDGRHQLFVRLVYDCPYETMTRHA